MLFRSPFLRQSCHFEIPEGCRDALALIGFMLVAVPDGAGDVLGLGRSDMIVSEMEEGVARECLLCGKEECERNGRDGTGP